MNRNNPVHFGAELDIGADFLEFSVWLVKLKTVLYFRLQRKKNNIIFNMSEIDKIDIQMSTVKVEPVDSEENSVEYTPNEAACFIQGQLKQEPLDIKEEPFESEDEKMQDDGGTVFRDANVSKSKSRKRKWKCSKVVETIQNKCYICDTTLESRNAFNDHLESHKNILPYKCTQCSTESNPIIFTTVVLLSRHFETHGFNYPCQECPLRFRTTTRLSYHIQNMHNRKTVEYQCKFCGKVFTNSYVYQSHVLVHKNLITQRFKCELCGKLFTSQHVLLKHQKAHTKPKENKPAKKSTKIERPKPDKLETTDNEGTPNQSEFTDECYICDTSFESRSDLNVHLESHKTMVPYRCSQCSNIAKFYTVTSLNKHFARHRFDYICPHCPSRFRSCRPLTLHMRNSHQGLTAEYKCKTCARIFTNSTGFQLHLKTHKHPKKQRPKCEPCQKVFFSERVLLGHRKTFMCMRNTERHLQLKNTSEGTSSQSLQNEGENKEDTAEHTINANSQDHDFDITETDKIDESNNQDSNDDLHQNNSTEENPDNGTKSNEIAGSTHDQLQQKPVESDGDKMDYDETTNGYDNEESSEGKALQKSAPKEGETIPNKCYICSTILENTNDFEDHLVSHRNMLPYHCAQCSTDTNPITVRSFSALNKHFERHEYDYICLHCPLRYRTSGSLKVHMRTSHKDQKLEYRCKTCEKVFTNCTILRNHIIAHKNLIKQRYQCEPCQKLFPAMSMLQKHKQSYKCLGKTEKSRLDVPEEGRMDTATSQEVYVILEMDDNDESNNQRSIVKSEPIDFDAKEAEESITDEEVTNSSQQHIDKEPIDIKDEPLKSDDEEMDNDLSSGEEPTHGKCYICDIVLANRNDFIAHLKYHKNLLPYSCSQCGTDTNPVTVSTLAALNKHFEGHDYDYACPYCLFRFGTCRGLTDHMRTTHEQLKLEYHCDTCKKVFTNSKVFRNHVVAHKNLKTKRYKCESCPRYFAIRSCLLRHQLVHTNQQPMSEQAQGSQPEMQQNEYDERENKNSIMETVPEETSNSNNEDSYLSEKGKSSCSGAQKRPWRDPKKVDTIPNKCYICDTVLESQSDFYVHLDSHRSMLPYECSQCSTETHPVKAITVITLNNHFERHGFKYICTQCPLRYQTLTSFRNHLRHAHGGQKTKYNCEHCEKVFINGMAYMNHMNGHKNLIKQRYKCDPCNEIFPVIHSLQNHQKSYQCMQNIEISQHEKTYKEESKSNDIAMVQIFTTDSNGEPTNQSSIVKLEPNDSDSEQLENRINHAGIAGSIEEQIKKEPIDIKAEPLTSDDGEMIDYDETTRRKKVLSIPNKCYICDTILANEVEFEDHLGGHQKMLPYRCVQCSTENDPITFSTVVLLNRHLETHGCLSRHQPFHTKKQLATNAMPSQKINFDAYVEAIKRCKINNGPLNATAKAYGVPRSSLQRFLKKVDEQLGDISNVEDGVLLGFIRRCSQRVPSNQIFTSAQEDELVKYVLECLRYEHCMSLQGLKELAYQFARQLGVDYPPSWDEDGKAGWNWCYKFMARHPRLVLPTPEQST